MLSGWRWAPPAGPLLPLPYWQMGYSRLTATLRCGMLGLPPTHLQGRERGCKQAWQEELTHKQAS